MRTTRKLDELRQTAVYIGGTSAGIGSLVRVTDEKVPGPLGSIQRALTKPAKPPPMAGRNPEVLQLRE